MGWDESRMEGEHQGWYQGHDPVMIYARRLLGDGDITQDELAEMDKRVTERLEKAREFALESPMPAAETALDNVFV